MTTSVCIRLPEDIVSELDELASSLERSRTFIIRKALETYLEEYADYQVALDRLRDKDDPVITPAQMRKRLVRKG